MTVTISVLRSELKHWEHAFSASHGGRKPGKDDIKQNPEIAAKYKAYNRLRSKQDGGFKDPSQPHRSPKAARQNHQPVFATPSKPSRTRHVPLTPQGPSHSPRHDLTPSGKPRSQHPWELDPYDSPASIRRVLHPNQHRAESPYSSPLPLRTALGPTPQRDGKALGLFDLLSASGGSSATPSKRKVYDLDSQTPSKPTTAPSPLSSGSAKRLRSPTFVATPMTKRFLAPDADDDESGLMKVGSDTPPFFRRGALFPTAAGPTDGSRQDISLSPVAVRMPPRRVGKGLSAIAQNMRNVREQAQTRAQVQDKNQDNVHDDDDLDALREAEAEIAADHNPQTQDSQGLAEDGETQGPQTWNLKKKGPKRSTRLVNLRPVRAKPRLEQVTEHPIEDADQDQDEYKPPKEADPDLDVPSDIETTTDNGHIRPGTGVKEAATPGEGVKGKKKEKKIAPTAHANFRALKIRNRGANARGNLRFRRR